MSIYPIGYIESTLPGGPLSGDIDEYGASFESTGAGPARGYSAFRYAVSPGYIETMGIPSASAAERRFAMILFGAFALVALVLAAAGIYGVLSGSVSERTREIGVRSALGASPGRILAMVARQGMTLTALGVAVGVAGAVVASQVIATLLFGISRLDPLTYLGAIAVLLGVSAIACWVPAWRAARIDPAITLRAE